LANEVRRSNEIIPRFLFLLNNMAYKSSKFRSVDPIGPPCRKKMYQSPEEAEEMIRHIRENRYVKELHAYRCEICGMWHLTHKMR
jgi:hypothetical protein